MSTMNTETMDDEHEVLIAGSGPVGMVLAAELAIAGVDVAIVDRRPDHRLAGSRAGGLHARTIELLDQRGIVERFLQAGRPAQAAMFATTVLDISDFPTRHPYALGLWQNKIEELLSGWLAELGVAVHHDCEVCGLQQDDYGVDLHLTGGRSVRSRYLVGCDGGRSVVRRAAAIAFPGWDATQTTLLGEMRMSEDFERGTRHDATGAHSLDYLEDGVTVRAMVSEQRPRTGAEPTLEEFKAALHDVYGSHFDARDPTWITRFSDATRQAATYRSGRVLLAGDAAHIHYPSGGQGISLGVHDAVNLGWKLAQVVHGTSPETLLDSYHDERHPIGARALEHTMAQAMLLRPDERIQPLLDTVGELVTMDEPRRQLAGLISGLDIHYDLGDGHPLLGRRMPDIDLRLDDRNVRMFELLHDARPVLLELAHAAPLDIGAMGPRVRHVRATFDAAWELPVIGTVDSPSAILVRPDGYVAWVGSDTSDGLTDALLRWHWTTDRPQSELIDAPARDSASHVPSEKQRPHRPRPTRVSACMHPPISRRLALSALAFGTAGLALALPTSPSAATVFPLPVLGTGTPVEVTAAHGTVAWLTVDAGSTTLHVHRDESTTTAPVDASPTTLIDRLSVGTDAAGRPVVLAVRRAAPATLTGPDGSRSGQDVVRIDPATGKINRVPAAAKAGVEETAASVERGALVFSRRAGDGKSKAVLYRSTLSTSKLTRFRVVSDLPSQPGATRSADVDELAIAPGPTTASRLTVAARAVGDAEFGSQAIDVVRRHGTPQRVVSWADGGAGLTRSIGGLSWETATRLWYADVDERGASTNPPFASRVVRYSTSTHRQAEVRTPVTIDDLAWVDGARGAVGVVRASTAAGVPGRLGATGPVTLSPYAPSR